MGTDYNKSAFPVLERGGDGLELTDTGMSLRDYFAIHAGDTEQLSYEQAASLIGEYTGVKYYNGDTYQKVSNNIHIDFQVWWEQAHAAFRYLKADAMLKARGEK